jgi:hypothetical protein
MAKFWSDIAENIGWQTFLSLATWPFARAAVGRNFLSI